MSIQVPDLSSPYVGLAPFDAAHADYFFGRTIDSAVIADNVFARPITVLYAPSGVGKSSVLNVGLPKALTELALPHQIVSYRDWHEPKRVSAWLRRIAKAPRSGQQQPLIVILDQFEEYFLYPDAEEMKTFAKSLGALIERTDIEVHLLFSLRDDSLHRLDALRGQLPTLLDTTLELRHLDEDAVREAIHLPIVQWNKTHERQVVVDPDFADVLLTQLRSIDSEGNPIKGGRIELAYLQLALFRIWEDAGGRDVTSLHTSMLTDPQKGVGEISSRHVKDSLSELSESEQALCYTVFDRLVTPSGGKILYSATDLASLAGVDPTVLDDVLGKLASGKSRLLRVVKLPAGKNLRGYEILHDMLARPILDWKETWAAKEAARTERARTETLLTKVSHGDEFGSVEEEDDVDVDDDALVSPFELGTQPTFDSKRAWAAKDVAKTDRARTEADGLLTARRPTSPSHPHITRSGIVWARRWNWDGNRIIHDAVVPSSRPVVGRRSGGYDIDPREFLVSERNAVMRSTLENSVRAFVQNAPRASWELFTSRAEGSFDHRVDMIAAFVSDKIAYRYGGSYDPWQFPDETLSVREGDCEDRALLIASLLLASGISSFNVRVALGELRLYGNTGRTRSFGHCWVMYKNEAGQWLVIEPAHARNRASQPAGKGLAAVTHGAYEPRYLFNDVHLWAVGDAAGPEASRPNLKKDWSRVNPSFVGIVHKSILNDALLGVGCPQWVLDKLNRNFTTWLGKPNLTTDAIDLNLAAYDPRDHFDNAYIDDAWQRAQANLDAFKANPTAQLDAFFQAAHSIADFYAHSSYAHFADTSGAKSIPLYDPANPAPGRPPDYGPGGDFDLASGRYTTNSKIWNGTAAEAAALWKGKIISGRYAQPGDSHSVGEWICVIPRELRRRPDFAPRGSLPHHNEIAVDDQTRDAKHTLYTTDAAYQRQFGLRYDAAKRHIAQVFKDRWKL